MWTWTYLEPTLRFSNGRFLGLIECLQDDSSSSQRQKAILSALQKQVPLMPYHFAKWWTDGVHILILLIFTKLRDESQANQEVENKTPPLEKKKIFPASFAASRRWGNPIITLNSFWELVAHTILVVLRKDVQIKAPVCRLVRLQHPAPLAACLPPTPCRKG